MVVREFLYMVNFFVYKKIRLDHHQSDNQSIVCVGEREGERERERERKKKGKKSRNLIRLFVNL